MSPTMKNGIDLAVIIAVIAKTKIAKAKAIDHKAITLPIIQELRSLHFPPSAIRKQRKNVIKNGKGTIGPFKAAEADVLSSSQFPDSSFPIHPSGHFQHFNSQKYNPALQIVHTSTVGAHSRHVASQSVQIDPLYNVD